MIIILAIIGTLFTPTAPVEIEAVVEPEVVQVDHDAAITTRQADRLDYNRDMIRARHSVDVEIPDEVQALRESPPPTIEPTPTPEPEPPAPEPKPEPPPPPPPPPSECPPSGFSVEHGLTPDALKVLRCVKEEFPQIATYYGVAQRSGVSDHPSGRAVDMMIPNWNVASGNELGWRIAHWVQERAGCLGVTYIIFDAKIWNTSRASEGWRNYMHSSGGTSATVLHLDHVHVSVEGNSAKNC